MLKLLSVLKGLLVCESIIEPIVCFEAAHKQLKNDIGRSACVTFLGVCNVFIFRWISHAMLDISTLFVYVLAFSEAFLRTSVLHVCAAVMSNIACEIHLKL